jgi:DNA-directed RNA polymerase subunit RPC12/RpoP
MPAYLDKCLNCGFNFADGSVHIDRCPRCREIRVVKGATTTKYMFDGYFRDQEYQAPAGWKVVHEQVRPFGTAVTLEKVDI